jgi:hypothetical protein
MWIICCASTLGVVAGLLLSTDTAVLAMLSPFKCYSDAIGKPVVERQFRAPVFEPAISDCNSKLTMPGANILRRKPQVIVIT